MKKLPWAKMAAAAVIGLAASATINLPADERSPEGVVRLTDQPVAGLEAGLADDSDAEYVVRAQSPTAPRMVVRRPAAAVSGHPCKHGVGSSCKRCYGGVGLPLGTVLHAPALLHGWWHGPHFCFQSPDHGWGAPVKSPVPYFQAEYQTYLPTHWYGDPAAPAPPAYPVVYQPTDTAQLGFYYQNVPFWQPAPGMLPPPPLPSAWHNREGLACPGGTHPHKPFGVYGGYVSAENAAPSPQKSLGPQPSAAVANSNGGKTPVKKVRVVRKVVRQQ